MQWRSFSGDEYSQLVHLICRMPVILSSADYDVWLDPAIQEADHLQPLLRPYPDEEMIAYPVSTRVNNPANDTPECLAPLR
ncbi:MAG: SOS response-associated peptidase family protein [Candidatus Methylomirabilales bacterium]